MELDTKIFVAGHRGMVGSALVRRLQAAGYTNIITRNRMQLELLDQRSASEFLDFHRPRVVFLAAGGDGGTRTRCAAPATLLNDNLTLQGNLVQGAHEAGVERLMFFADPCVYPAEACGPLAESQLFQGPPAAVSLPLALAKQAGIALCDAYRRQFGRQYFSVVPAGLYGPGARFDAEHGHVLPALMRRAHEAHEAGETRLQVWGSGAPLRDFLHVDDLADACLLLMREPPAVGVVNVGSGVARSIREAAAAVCRAVGLDAELVFDAQQPEGVAERVLDCGELRARGWQPQVDFDAGLAATYAAFVEAGAGKKKKKRAAATGTA